MLCKECRKVLTFAVWLPPSYMDCYLSRSVRIPFVTFVSPSSERSDEQLRLETSAFESLYGGQLFNYLYCGQLFSLRWHIINPVDKTKLSCFFIGGFHVTQVMWLDSENFIKISYFFKHLNFALQLL